MGYVEELRALVGHRPLLLPGAVVLVVDAAGRLLLQRRTQTLWGLPGGLMELGESAEETARREVREETGLTLGALELLDVFSGADFFLQLENGDAYYSLTVAYVCREPRGTLHADGRETLELRYFPPGALPAHVSERHRRIIARWRERTCGTLPPPVPPGVSDP